MNRLYFIIVVSYIRHSSFVVLSMVVKTRSQYSRQQEQQEQQQEQHQESTDSSGRRVRITTPSFREASIRTYKEYTPSSSSVNSRKQHKKHAVAVKELSHHEDVDALLSLQDAVPPSSPAASRRNEYLNHACMNPMNSVTKYLYRVSVY